MKIIFFETMPGERESFMRLLPPGHEVVFRDDKLSGDDEVIAAAAGADVVSVFVNCDASAAVIDRLPGLKLITTRSMGYDHIALDHAKTRGIRVANVTSYASHPVAEFTFALMLTVVRKIYPAYDQLRAGSDWDIRPLQGMTLNGKTLAVIGTGRIGKNVCAIAKGFGMNIIAFDMKPDEAAARELGFTYASLPDALAQADVVSLHVPYMKETHHLINAEMFAKMKKGMYLVNTARGEVMDTHALVAAVGDGTVAGAGLDVLEDERTLKEEGRNLAEHKQGINYELLAANHFLIDHPAVIVTPHIAFSTRQAMDEIERVTAETISNFIAGKEQKYL